MHNRISLLRRIITFNVQLLSHNKTLAVIRKYISESQIKQDKNFYKDLHKNVFVKFPSLIKLYLVSDPEIKKKEKVENVEMQGYEEGKNIDVEMQEKEDEYNGEEEPKENVKFFYNPISLSGGKILLKKLIL